MRKHDVNEINLKIENLIPFVNESARGFIIQWVSDIGWGEYTIFKMNESNEWIADSEYMDNNENKDFIKKLMELFIEKLTMI